MTRRRILQAALGVAVVAAILLAVGTEPFLRGLAAVTPPAILAAAALTALSTAAAAFRWRAVAGGLGLRMRWTDAVAACYRSQLLNSVLPGGILGDVHRAYRHGRGAGDYARAARAVATERIAGQVVQLLVAAAVLASLGLRNPLGGMAWPAGAIALFVVLGVAIALATTRGRRVLARELALLGAVFSDPRRAIAIVASSVLVVASLSATFVIACLAVGVRAPVLDIVAVALVALSAASLPINVAGWGPREAGAASAFALVGLGAAAGVAASTAFGVLTLIAVAPGAIVLLVDRIVAARATIPQESAA